MVFTSAFDAPVQGSKHLRQIPPLPQAELRDPLARRSDRLRTKRAGQPDAAGNPEAFARDVARAYSGFRRSPAGHIGPAAEPRATFPELP